MKTIVSIALVIIISLGSASCAETNSAQEISGNANKSKTTNGTNIFANGLLEQDNRTSFLNKLLNSSIGEPRGRKTMRADQYTFEPDESKNK